MHPLFQFQYCPKCGSSHFVENDFKSKKCLDCNFVYYFNSSSATVALIMNERNELLVATRANDPAKGTLDLLGGFVDMDETAEEAVMREVKEESGLNVLEVKYLFSIPNRYVYSGFETHTVDMFFECKVSDISKLNAADDVARLEFIKLAELDPEKFGLLSIREGIKRVMNLEANRNIK